MPARPRDACSSGTALVASPKGGLSTSCVYWFIRYSSAVRQGTSATCWPSLLTYPEDPQPGHQAAVTLLCHVQVARLGAELLLLLLPEPEPTTNGTRAVRSTFHTTVQAQTENIIYCWAPEGVLASEGWWEASLLPDLNTTGYCLRQRRHHRILPSKTGCMQSNNFLTRLLYRTCTDT